MAPRLQLQTLLEGLLDSRNVYYQPPSNLQMAYPAIVYSREDIDTKFAGNKPYSLTNRYQVTVIDRDPENEALPKIAELPMCVFDRHYVADGLNHDVYTLYF